MSFERQMTLRSRQRSQWRFKMSVNVCPDDIFWIAEHFATKAGMVMQHHEPECLAGKKCLQSSRSRSQHRLTQLECDFFYYIFWIADSLATKPGLMVHHHNIACLKKKKIDYCFQGQGHSEGSKCHWMFVQIISSKPPNLLLPNLVLSTLLVHYF